MNLPLKVCIERKHTLCKNSQFFFCILTIGGLLICLPGAAATAYCEELEKIDGRKAWIIGDVIKGPREAKITENVEVLEV